MRDLFEFLELRLVEVPDHPYRQVLIDYGPPDERGGRKIRAVTAPDPWTPKALEALTRLHKAKLPLTTAGLMKWLKAGNAETCSHRTLIDAIDVIHARDAAGLDDPTSAGFVYIDKIIHNRLVAMGCGWMSIS